MNYSKALGRLYFRFLQNSDVTMSELVNHLVRHNYIDLVIDEKNQVRWQGKVKMNSEEILKEIRSSKNEN